MKKMTFGEKVIEFYELMTPPDILMSGVEVIQTYKDPRVWDYAKKFFHAYFHDTNNRVFVIGINPGRFGSGMTGVPFTDPIALEEMCGIVNEVAKRREISSEFIYKFIEYFGGVRNFYDNFFLTAVSPVGFTLNGVNCNYYDSPDLFSAVQSFIVETMTRQIACGARRDVAIVLGSGKNQKVFSKLNKENGWFKKLYVLEHPRFIMQYRRKYLQDYLEKYHDIFCQTLL